MCEMDELIRDIDKLRQNLEQIIKEKDWNLLDHDVLSASKLLNAAITEYNKMIESKLKNKDSK